MDVGKAMTSLVVAGGSWPYKTMFISTVLATVVVRSYSLTREKERERSVVFAFASKANNNILYNASFVDGGRLLLLLGKKGILPTDS